MKFHGKPYPHLGGAAGLIAAAVLILDRRSGRRSPFEQFQAADEKGSPEDAAQQRGAQDAAVAALLEEGGPENGADGPAGGGDEVHDGQAEAALLWRGDVGDEGIEAHLKGQVAAGDGHYIERSKLLPF